MNYFEAVDYIHSLQKFGIRPGLSRMDALLCILGEPHKKLKCVHIAGTNGKGSTSTAISNILINFGLRVGLYTSPFVSEFLERIQFNGTPVERDLFAKCTEKVKNAVDILNKDGVQITEFEALTASAFLCFCELSCDVAVLEVGLGGRLDATNVIDTPLVNVITSLSLDHTKILGDTVEKIAFEKCGTIKMNGRVVSSYGQPDGAFKVISEACEKTHSTLTIPDESKVEILSTDIFGTEFVYKNNLYKTSMAGLHQVKNMTAAIEASELLKGEYSISYDNIKDGIENTVLPARVEVISKNPLVILDGGHNLDGARAFYSALKSALSDRSELTVVAGMMADKAVEASLKPLMSVCGTFYAVTPENPRAMSAEALGGIAERYCSDVKIVENACEAVKAAYGNLKENGVLCVVGSLYLAGEMRNELIKIAKTVE